MTQPLCIERPPTVLLDIYAARVGEPLPTGLHTPLTDGWMRVGAGEVRIDPRVRDWNDGLLTRTIAGPSKLTITWDHCQPWHEPGVMYSIVGQRATVDGWHLRAVAGRASHIENHLNRGVLTTTADLFRTDPAGGDLTWYYRKVEPVGQVWRGRNHGSLLKVVELQDTHVRALVMASDNPYWAERIGTVQRIRREWWDEYIEYAPEWNEPQ